MMNKFTRTIAVGAPLILLIVVRGSAQQGQRTAQVRQASSAQRTATYKFTHADTLRGSITPERAWWDVQRYDITIRPDFDQKFTSGSNVITYKVVSSNHPPVMQIDLMEPLTIDSIFSDGGRKLEYTRDGNAWHVSVPDQKMGSEHKVTVYFSGHPVVAVRPPWNGGWTFTRDSLGRPWMTVTCQGMGASVWYPCKDHQSDEPDKGASMTLIVPDTLVGVSNGRLQYTHKNGDGTATWKWAVVNPISNYCLIPYIGKYVHFGDTYNGEKGKLDLDYWVLDYNLEKAKSYFADQVPKMLKAFEYWFGPYPFYEDSYKLVDVEHTGMEHQSAVAYGNHYAFGYRGRDGSGTGYGLKSDFIIVHESGHEWFGNNLTTKDLADMYVHEGFINYSESLYVDYWWGKEAGNEYVYGTRRGIHNDRPIIGHYGVNEEGSGDMYPKGGNMLHSVRHSMDNDSLFRQILRGLGKTLYHQTVTSDQVLDYISKKAGYDYKRVFYQYLHTTQIPTLEYYFGPDHKSVSYRYVDCVPGFDLPLVLKSNDSRIRIIPGGEWKTTALEGSQAGLFDVAGIEKMYYIGVMESKGDQQW
jgi:aminopeptidase N